MDAVARRGKPVAVDLVVDVLVGDNRSTVVFISRHKRVTQVLGLCWITRKKGGELVGVRCFVKDITLSLKKSRHD